jgi:hypothetical protein
MVVPADRCPRCYSDDFMRHFAGVGVEYGTDWVIEHILEEYCTPVDGEELFEQLLDDCYEEIKLCNCTYSPCQVLKEVDPIAFQIGAIEMLDNAEQYYECNGNHYVIDDIETVLDEFLDSDDGPPEFTSTIAGTLNS